jgi:hypothetical protein
VNRLRVLLLGSCILLLPSLLLADDATLKICNKASIELDVAVASRVQLLITGYKWDINGWYVVAPGSCAVVYSAEYDEAGLLTPQSGARIAYTAVNSQGQWGAYHSGVVNDGGWVRTGTGSICVKRGVAFEMTKPAGDPAADCDGISIPVADEFLPPEPGNYTLTMAWEGDRFFVPFGVKKGSKARLIFGEEVTSDGNKWSYANGTPLPENLIIKKTGFPPLLPKWQHSTKDVPVAGYIKQIKDIMGSVNCTHTVLFNTKISSAQFDMDDYGVVIATDTETVPGLAQPITRSHGAAIANLSLDEAKVQPSGCVLVSAVCKDGVQCVRDNDDSASVYWSFFVNTNEQADQVLSALRNLAAFYPDGKGEIH